MPEIKYFEVTQTRVVHVQANRHADAAVIAEAAFEHGQNSDNGIKIEKAPVGIWGNTTSKITTVDLTVELERR